MNITRRDLLLSLPALTLMPRLFAQTAKPTIPVKTLNHFTLNVSDVKRSLDFYQGLFGMPIQGRQGQTVLLRIGNGPQYMALAPAGSNPPSFGSDIGMTVDSFNADRLIAVLAQHGITKAEAGDPGLSGGPMKVRVEMRGGTPELFLGDPDGFVIQLADTKYCGGCLATPEPSPKKGLIALKDLNHFTIGVSNATRSNTFYQELFGLPIRSRQGTAPALGIGPDKMFVMFAGGGGGRGGAAAAAPRANIAHVCLNMENFNPDNILSMLAGYGIGARGAGGGAGPLKSWVTMRMENRGGAPGGTPELYFSDPDGLQIQLQDVSYCGGGGFLGNTCLA